MEGLTHNEHEPILKTLGVVWRSEKDDFSLTFQEHGTARGTKRSVLGYVDCLVLQSFGIHQSSHHWSSHFVPKDVGTWEYELGWDDPLPEELQKEWRRWVSSAGRLGDLCIPRLLAESGWPHEDWATHVFVDASDSAHATVIYVVQHGEGKAVSRLVASKARVNPLAKKESLFPPRSGIHSIWFSIGPLGWVTVEK